MRPLPEADDFELATRARIILRPGRTPDHHARDRLILAFGRWGTCSACPFDHERLMPRPDLCELTARSDHNLDVEAE